MDLEPQGPLPQQIYWRRRGLALGIAVVVMGAVVALIAVLGSSAGTKSTDADKNADGATTADSQAEAKTPIGPPAPDGPAPNPTPTAAVEPPPVLQQGDDCPDSTLAVKGLTNQPRYPVGEQPQFTMVVTNIGLVSCKRDVGAAVLAAYVYSLDNQRLWSNLDCAPSNETLVKTFGPGEQVTTAVTWTGMGSAPQCPLPREPIGPGTYNLVVQLGNLRSAPMPFVLAESSPGSGDAPAGVPQLGPPPGPPGPAPGLPGPPPGPPPGG